METIKTPIKSKFLQACIGVSMVLLSLGFLFQSLQKANASPSIEKFTQAGNIDKVGKYVFQQLTQNGKQLMFVYDSETGVSKFYAFDKIWMPEVFQLPANPCK